MIRVKLGDRKVRKLHEGELGVKTKSKKRHLEPIRNTNLNESFRKFKFYVLSNEENIEGFIWE